MHHRIPGIPFTDKRLPSLPHLSPTLLILQQEKYSPCNLIRIAMRHQARLLSLHFPPDIDLVRDNYWQSACHSFNHSNPEVLAVGGQRKDICILERCQFVNALEHTGKDCFVLDTFL